MQLSTYTPNSLYPKPEADNDNKNKTKNTIRLKTGQRLAATWKDLEMIILSEVSQTEKDKHMISLIRGIQNMTQMNLSIKQKRTRRHRELMLTKGERGGGKGVRR